MTTPTSLPLTIRGVTRDVEVTDTFKDGSRLDSVHSVALSRVGRAGTKLWPTTVLFWRQKDGTYRANMTSNRIRLPAQIVAWNDAEFDKYKTQRNG